ncbi:MAG: hypothetical protein ACJAV3_000831 [Alcanivorax sp.]|jgi:hypothetical protein
MRPIILFIANAVFPKAALPDSSFITPYARWIPAFHARYFSGEGGLDQSPAPNVIIVGVRELQDAVEMIRQYHPAMNTERVVAFHFANRLSQYIHMTDKQIVAASLLQIDGKEIAAAWLPDTAVHWHLFTSL